VRTGLPSPIIIAYELNGHFLGPHKQSPPTQEPRKKEELVKFLQPPVKEGNFRTRKKYARCGPSRESAAKNNRYGPLPTFTPTIPPPRPVKSHVAVFENATNWLPLHPPAGVLML
jgi:hypothetical protein